MGKVGSQDVAKLAGVSRSTVSRVFTPGAYVKKETRTKVLAAAEMLGYRPNVIARSLTMRSTRLVGIVTGHLENPSHAALVRQIAKGLQDMGLASLLVTAHYDEADRVIDSLMSYQVDALILTSAVPTAAIAMECRKAGIPLIVTHQRNDPEGCLAVYGDNADGASQVADHLVRQGWTRFAFIAGVEELPTSRGREDAFTMALARRGYALIGREVGNFQRQDAAVAMRQLLSLDPPPNAVFCANDEMAVAALDVARFDFGLEIGRDIAVVGYDDGPLAALRGYDLTSVRANISELASAAVALVEESRNVADPMPRAVAIAPDLVVRSSSIRKPV